MFFGRKRELQTESRDSVQESRFTAIRKAEGAIRLSVFSKSRTAVENITITAEQVENLQWALEAIEEFPHMISIQDKSTPIRTYNEDGPGSSDARSRIIRVTIEDEKDRTDLLAALQ